MYQGTITRRMKTTRSDVYRSMLTRYDFEAKLAKLQASKSSQRPTICASLCEMFEAMGIECENDREDAYYEELVRTSSFPSFRNIELRIMETMFDNFDKYPTPEEYMLRIVKRLSDSEDGWQNDPLRLQILKRFIKYCNCLTFQSDSGKVCVYGGEGYLKKYAKEKKGVAVKKGENILQYIDDGVFDVLAGATKAQKKPEGTYGILKLADDLALGRFKAGGATKRDLYMFAIAFDMTYSVNGEVGALETTELFDYESDIEKNLFEDYYANNLMRFITAAYEGDLSAFELDPSGQGINYKNFAEMVYIYFISKNYDPIEKLKRSTQMIERLKNAKRETSIDRMSTRYYETLFTEEILKMPESVFELFISENYDCNVEFEDVSKKGEKFTSKKGVLQLHTEQQTAFKLYTDLINEMEKDSPDAPAFLRENCNYGLWFCDVSMIEKTERSVLKDFAEGKDKEKIEKFIELLYGINMFLGQLFIESESGLSEEQEHTAPSKRLIKKMTVDKPEDMTRTALIVAYYYRYNQLNEQRGLEKSFVDVWDDYSDSSMGLNSLLEAAGYQPINDRNIFDLAVIFSSYAYLAI